MRSSFSAQAGTASDPVASFAPVAGQALIPVELEVPPIWLSSPLDGERNRQMFSQLCCALATKPLAIHMSSIGPGMYDLPREAPAGGFVLSYHSYGDGPNIWRIKETPIAGWYSVDETGYSGWSSFARFPERYAEGVAGMNAASSIEFVNRIRTQLREKNESKYKQTLQAFDVRTPYVYFPLQVLSDPVSQFYRLDCLDVLGRAAEIAERTGITLVVKRHPLCESPVVDDALKKLTARFSRVVVSQASVHQHLENCQSVIVANSGVGMEALLYFKPVFTFGSSEYELATQPIHSLDEVELAFAPVFDDVRARCAKFMAYYLQKCCFSIHDPKSVERIVDIAIRSIRPVTSPTNAPSPQTQLQSALMKVDYLSRKLSETTLRGNYLAKMVMAAEAKLRAMDKPSTAEATVAVSEHTQPAPTPTSNALMTAALALFDATFRVSDAMEPSSDIIGDWLTESGQMITFTPEFTMLMNGKACGRWVQIEDGAAVHWTDTEMLDLVEVEEHGDALTVTTLKGESFRVSRRH